MGVISGERGGQRIGSPLPIHLFERGVCWINRGLADQEHVKDIVYKTKVRDINDLKERITDAIATVDEAMLERTWMEIEYRHNVPMWKFSKLCEKKILNVMFIMQQTAQSYLFICI
jgi:hypothetical protein